MSRTWRPPDEAWRRDTDQRARSGDAGQRAQRDVDVEADASGGSKSGSGTTQSRVGLCFGECGKSQDLGGRRTDCVSEKFSTSKLRYKKRNLSWWRRNTASSKQERRRQTARLYWTRRGTDDLADLVATRRVRGAVHNGRTARDLIAIARITASICEQEMEVAIALQFSLP